MPNAVKYKTGNLTGSLQKGNVALGISGSLGPTSTTGWYNGPNPVAGKYQIFETAASGDPEVYCPQDDAELIKFARWKGATGADTGSAAAVLAWIGTQTNLMAANFQYESIVTDGLVLNLDAGFVGSYPTINTTWYDISGNANNGTLTNGPTFNSANSGSIVFDGIDDYVGRNTALDVGSNFSAFAWVRPGSINVRNAIIGNSYPYQSGVGWFLATATNYSGVTNTFFISIGSDSAYQTAANNSIVLNTWNYIGGTVINGGQNIKLYVNGIETAYLPSNLSANTIVYTSPELNIGRRFSSNPEPWIGNIASTQIYNRILSSSEVLQNYNAQKGRFGL